MKLNWCARLEKWMLRSLTAFRLLKRDLIKFLNESKKSGKIKHVGFSYHGSKEEFELLLDATI